MVKKSFRADELSTIINMENRTTSPLARNQITAVNSLLTISVSMRTGSVNIRYPLRTEQVFSEALDRQYQRDDRYRNDKHHGDDRKERPWQFDIKSVE